VLNQRGCAWKLHNSALVLRFALGPVCSLRFVVKRTAHANCLLLVFTCGLLYWFGVKTCANLYEHWRTLLMPKARPNLSTLSGSVGWVYVRSGALLTLIHLPAPYAGKLRDSGSLERMPVSLRLPRGSPWSHRSACGWGLAPPRPAPHAYTRCIPHAMARQSDVCCK
jgi:hypothetical protein